MLKKNFNYFLGIKKLIFSINALIYRELKTRVSSSTLGLLGVFSEPLLSLLVFILIFSLRKSRSIYGLDIYIFLTCGILIFTIFSNIAFRSLNAIQANEPLIRTYKHLKIIDTVIARSIIEAYLNLILLILILVPIFLHNSEIIINNINLSFMIYILTALFSFGVGLIILVVSSLYPVTQNLLPFITRPLFIISGIFFSIKSIPENLKKIIVWNPILHFIELFRNSFYGGYIIEKDISLEYAFYASLTTLIIGLILYFSFEDKLLRK